MNPSSCISVDMDSLECYADIHGAARDEDPRDPVWSLGMERCLELFEEAGVKATFFCVGRDMLEPRRAELARQAVAAGHEVASHSFSHLYDLRSSGEQTIAAEIDLAQDAILKAVGVEAVGFRTPGYNLSPSIAEALRDRGFLYDSSLFPCPAYYGAKGLVMAKMRLGGTPSRSQMTLPQTLTAPTRPYRCEPQRPWRHAGEGTGGLWEIPMSLVPGLRFPLIGTSLHLVGARGFSALMPALRRAHPDLFNLEFHGIDFVDTSDQGVPDWLRRSQPDLKISLGDKRLRYKKIFSRLSRAYHHRTLRDAVTILDTRNNT